MFYFCLWKAKYSFLKYSHSAPVEGKIFFMKYSISAFGKQNIPFWNIRVLPRQQGLPTACATSKGDGSWGRGGQGGESKGALDDDADDDDDDGHLVVDEDHLVGDVYWGGQGDQSQGGDDADEDDAYDDDGHLVGDEDHLVGDDYRGGQHLSLIAPSNVSFSVSK